MTRAAGVTEDRVITQATGEGPSSVRRRTIDSLAWVAVTQFARGLLFFAVPAVLANMVGAHEVGSAEIGLAVFGIAMLFIELGTGPAIVQRPVLDQQFLSTVFYINVATGLLFGAGLYVSAPHLASILNLDSRASHYLQAVAPSFLFLALAIVQRSLLARRMAFRTLAGVNVGAVVAALLIAWASFKAGAGGDAIVGGVLGFSLTMCGGLWAAGRWIPSARFDRRQVLPLFRFSLSVSASSALDNLSTQWERFLIAALLSPADLGVYSLARHLHRTPLRHLMQITDTVLFPGLSMIQSDKARCRSYYLAALRHELALLGPLLAGMAVFAQELVLVVYGDRWIGLVPLLYLTVPVTLRMVTGHTVGAVFLSQGRSDVQLKWVTLSIVLMTAYTVIGGGWGIHGVAVAVLVLGCSGWLVSHLMANRLIELRFPEFLRNLRIPIFATLILGAVLWPVAEGLRAVAPGEVWLRLTVGFILAAGLGALLLRLLDPSLLISLRRSLAEAVGSRGDS